jgi:predicted dehydrogenase
MIYRRILSFLLKKLFFLGLYQPKKNPQAIKWGIIGLGNIAEVFASAIDLSQYGLVASASSRNIEKAKRFGIRHRCRYTYGSYEEMLNDLNNNIDIVYVATPVASHYLIVKRCLEAGKNVLCEKPITETPEQLSELIRIANRTGSFIMEGMWMKCLPPFTNAKKWIDNKEIGSVTFIKVDFYKHEIVNTNLAIFDSQRGGGILKDFGVYAIAFIEEFMNGIPKYVEAKKRNSIYNIDCDWQIYAQKENIKAFINLSSDFNSKSRATIYGTNGFISFEPQFNRTNSLSLYNLDGTLRKVFKTNYISQGFEYEVEEVFRCLNNNQKQSAKVSIYSSMNVQNIIAELFDESIKI